MMQAVGACLFPRILLNADRVGLAMGAPACAAPDSTSANPALACPNLRLLTNRRPRVVRLCCRQQNPSRIREPVLRSPPLVALGLAQLPRVEISRPFVVWGKLWPSKASLRLKASYATAS